MKHEKSLVLLLLVTVAALGVSCIPTYDDDCVAVYVSDECTLVDAAGAPLNPLKLQPGDCVTWINNTDEVVWIDFHTNKLFGRPKVRLNPGKSTSTTVKRNAKNQEFYIELSCGGDDSSTPKVNVGGGSGGGG